MTLADQQQSPILITAGEIAEIAGVGPSAVSNWKRRRADFPGEIEDGLYDQAEIVAWLHTAGKDVHLREESAESLVWRLMDAVRTGLPADEVPEVVLQLFVFRAAGSGEFDRLLPLSDLWDLTRSDTQDRRALYQSASTSVGDSDADLARALRFPPALDRLEASDWARLVSLVDRLDPTETDWGRAATALIEGFIERHGAKGGEHSSGSALVDIMDAILSPVEGAVYDPACGSGVFLAATWRQNRDAITKLFGQEVNEQSWRLGFLHLLLHNASFELVTGDTLLDDQLWRLRADRIALEPPLGQNLRSPQQMEGDPRWSWGLPPKGRADLAWVEHAAFHLSESGIGVVVVPPGALLRGGAESSIREQLVQSDLVDAVVLLPPGMLASTSIPVALVVLQRGRPDRSGKILFVDARQLGTPERGGLRRFDASETAQLREVFVSWRDGSLEPEIQFTGIATADDVLELEGLLTPNRYISYAKVATDIDGEPVDKRLERLAGKLDGQMEVLEDFYGREDEVRRLLAVAQLDQSPYTAYRLGELLVGEPQSGVRQKSQKDAESDHPTPYVTAELVRAASESSLPLVGEPSEVTYGDVRDRLLESEDLLLHARGVGGHEPVHCAIVSGARGATFAESLIRLRVDDTLVHAGFLQLYLTSRRGRSALAAASTGSIVGSLHLSSLQEVEVFLPDLETQQQLVYAVEPMELQLDDLERTHRTYWDLYDTARESIVAGTFTTIEDVDGKFIVRASSTNEVTKESDRE